MTRLICLAGALALLLVPVAPVVTPAAGAEEGITPQQVRDAIDRGIRYLKQQQRQDGSWPDYGGQPGGLSGLCTLALLNAGVPTDDDSIRRALSHLERYTKPQYTYATSLQTMVFCRANPSQYLTQIDRNVKWLEAQQIDGGPNRGAWNYPVQGNGDNSNTQFALLALHEAELAGVEVQRSTWARAKAYWESAQNPDGSWGYQKSSFNAGTGSMTCAGISSLVICNEGLSQAGGADAVVSQQGQILCCQKGESDNDRIERGLDWLGRNFSVDANPGSPFWRLYYLYGMERVGRLTARRFFIDPQRGPHDWYREGTERLVSDQVRNQKLQDFWIGSTMVDDNPIVGTSFALLFLSKGRRPILLAKLQHSLPDDWNEHRHDVHNLTRFVESRWKMDLNWQVMDIRAATVEDLLHAPVLYYCGGLDPLPAAPADRQALAHKLRDYLDRGGFLFAEAYCGGNDFDAGFRKLMEEVFPEPEYRLRLLDPAHPIWRAEEPLPPEQMRPLWGVDFGCRTSVVYAPPDPAAATRPSLSCLWELSWPGWNKRYSEGVTAQIRGALVLGTNILAYATNRELQPGENFLRDRGPRGPRDQLDRGRLYIANVRHPGGCNAAPRALVNLLEQASQELGIRTAASPELVNLDSDALFDYHLVFMHGRNSFRLTDTERKQLKAYVERGGMVLADSICGSAAFTESFRREMATILPGRPLEPIPADDPMWTTAYGGFDLKEVTRRDPQRSDENGPLRAVLRKVPPELEGIKLDGRWSVIFSPYDISCALEKHDSLECHGYVRDDAARIALNVLLYSIQE